MSIVSVSELAARLAAGDPIHVLDVRWKLGDPHGREQYLAGHLPGAVYVDLDTELAAHGEPAAGRHPLPSLASLQEAARRWGLRPGEPVVVLDAIGGLAAARLWWLLRWAGVDQVQVLDGGLAAWVAAGLEVETGLVVPVAGAVTLTGGHLPVLTIDQAAALPQTGILLDARAGERYRGDVEPIDPQAGHVPGAISAPTTENLTADGIVRPLQELRDRFAALGVSSTTPVGVYCGSGVTAAHTIHALALIGVEAALYPGSWSQWSNDPARPVAVGPQP